jgi:hypothetical protein
MPSLDLSKPARRISSLGQLINVRCCAQCPLLGGKADIIQGKADIKKCPLMTQSGHEIPAGGSPDIRLLRKVYRCRITPAPHRGQRSEMLHHN